MCVFDVFVCWFVLCMFFCLLSLGFHLGKDFGILARIVFVVCLRRLRC